MNSEREERVKQIRERRERVKRERETLISEGLIAMVLDPSGDDIDFLLSLYDSLMAHSTQFAEKTYRGQYEAVNDAATRMRDLCVEKVKALRDSRVERLRNDRDPLWNITISTLNSVIEELESLTLDNGEQEQK